MATVAHLYIYVWTSFVTLTKHLRPKKARQNVAKGPFNRGGIENYRLHQSNISLVDLILHCTRNIFRGVNSFERWEEEYIYLQLVRFVFQYCSTCKIFWSIYCVYMIWLILWEERKILVQIRWFEYIWNRLDLAESKYCFYYWNLCYVG